ncbi:hypothetical protein RclHR1_01550032 [Rhizophagus clarus]|uniref:Tetratricopeptide repeat protein n=1 Tax=Rhizophagus clarus TaxID=94130 RepID=A0A2Z6R811_9GLOM|nr:hypothetical protein RclHR1_01550032 [Rhizophagus clarus]GET01142.1 tetratricopeptide repeat protein [Rhizophagus clarus]
MNNYTILIKKHNYYDVSRYSESSDNELDSSSDISFSDHELQLKEIVITSDFNNNLADNEEFDSEDYNEDYDHSNDNQCDHNEHNNKSSYKMLSFVCNVKGCLKKFPLKSSLKSHIQQHHHREKNPFVCAEPNEPKRYQHENRILYNRSNPELDKILESNEIKIYERKYPCKIPGCDRVFDSKSAVASHKRHHNTEKEKKSYKCDVLGCEKIFKNLFELWDHDLFHLENDNKVCDEPELSQTFQNLQESNDDQQQINTNDNLGNTEIDCDVQGCNFKIGQFEALKQHLNDHHNMKNYYICNKEGCSFCCTNDSNFYNHQQIHVDNNVNIVHAKNGLFKCEKPGCGKVYERLCHLSYHQNRRKHHISTVIIDQQNHSQVEENYICDEPGCDNVYKSLYWLKQHKDHHHIKILLPYVYIDNVNFDFNQVNTYCCNDPGCFYTTKQMENLTKHKMIHTEENHFTTTSENEIHNLRKLDQISYRKDQFFVKNTKFNSFLLTKSKKKIYSRLCNYQGCNKRFITLTKLKKHRVKAHSIGINKLFTLKSQSKNHNTYKYMKKIQIPIKVTYDFVNKKQSDKLDISNDKSKEDVNNNKIKEDISNDKLKEDISNDKSKEDISNDKSKEDINNNKSKEDISNDKSNEDISNNKSKEDINNNKLKKDISNDKLKEDISNDKLKKDISNDKSKEDISNDKSKKDISNDKSKEDINNDKSKEDINNDKSKKDISNDKSMENISNDKSKKNISNNKSKEDINNNKLKEDINNDKSKEDINNDKLKEDINNNKSKKIELDTYSHRLRKRPRINKLNLLDDDDNDCLCKYTGCRKIFNSIYSLKVHQQKFHMITKTYPCNKSNCNFRTKFFEKLKKHQLEKHEY